MQREPIERHQRSAFVAALLYPAIPFDQILHQQIQCNLNEKQQDEKMKQGSRKKTKRSKSKKEQGRRKIVLLLLPPKRSSSASAREWRYLPFVQRRCETLSLDRSRKHYAPSAFPYRPISHSQFGSYTSQTAKKKKNQKRKSSLFYLSSCCT